MNITKQECNFVRNHLEKNIYTQSSVRETFVEKITYLYKYKLKKDIYTSFSNLNFDDVEKLRKESMTI